MGNIYGVKVIKFVNDLATIYNSYLDSMFEDIDNRNNPFEIKE